MKSIFVLMNFLAFAVFIFTIITTSMGEHVKKSIDDIRDDSGETNYESKDEGLDISIENEPANITCTRRQNSQMHEIRRAKHSQFPFMVAIMSQQNEYLCSGSIVSNGLIVTTATCTLQTVSHVLLNTTTDKKDDTTVSAHITKSERFPTFTTGEGSKDIGILYTEKYNNSIASKIKLNNYTNPSLLANIEGLGFGINADVGHTKELQYVGLEVRYTPEVAENVKGYFDCVETKVTTCFKDTGGPVVFDNELMGIIIKGQTECTKEMSATYAVNKKMIEFIPTYVFKAWLDEKIKKNEEEEPVVLAIYPSQPASRRSGEPHKMTALHDLHSGSKLIKMSTVILSVSMYILVLF